MRKRIIGLWLVCCSMMAYAQRVTYNILDFGATHDTTQVQTAAINAAIEACHKGGGGKVIVPAGNYRTGTLFLKDHVELHLETGACLYASEFDKDFPVQPPAHYRSQKDADGWISLIYAVEANHISITGNGVIDGRGKGRGGHGKPEGIWNKRPRNILFISCQDVRVEGITMRNAGMWNQHYLDCEDVTIDHIQVYNHCNGNNDGIDIDGCRRLVLTGSIIDSDDDAIVLKSTGPAPCEDVVISNCIVSSFANGIKCGTESTGGFKNILISDCIVKPSRNHGERFLKSTVSGITALSLELVDGGVMDGVTITGILIEGTECPLYVRLANRGRKYIEEAEQPAVGQMRNIQISNITAYNTGNFCASITGIPEAKIENIYLSNIRFMNRGGLKEGDFLPDPNTEGKRHDLVNDNSWSRYWASFREVVEDEQGYPQPTVWGNLPSFGLFVRHVGTLCVDGASFRPQGEEPRVPLIAVDVDDLRLHQLSVEGNVKRDLLLHQVKHCQADEILLGDVLHVE